MWQPFGGVGAPRPTDCPLTNPYAETVKTPHGRGGALLRPRSYPVTAVCRVPSAGRRGRRPLRRQTGNGIWPHAFGGVGSPRPTFSVHGCPGGLLTVAVLQKLQFYVAYKRKLWYNTGVGRVNTYTVAYFCSATTHKCINIRQFAQKQPKSRKSFGRFTTCKMYKRVYNIQQ